MGDATELNFEDTLMGLRVNAGASLMVAELYLDRRHQGTDAKIVSISSGMDRCRPIPGVALYLQYQ
jgi:hypothetical protein